MNEQLSQICIQHLQNEYAKRARVNSRFSLRAFAKQLDIDSSSLSQILSGKRALTAKMLSRLSRTIGLNLQLSYSDNAKFSVLESDHFATIADWYHFAILDLISLRGSRHHPKWVAAALQISESEAKIAIERLIRMRLLERRGKKLVKTKRLLTNYSEGETSNAHREYQRQVITKALAAVDQCSAESKDITSITLAGNSKKIAQAKVMIREFRRNLCRFMEDENADRVFHLTVQLYPVSAKGDSK